MSGLFCFLARFTADAVLCTRVKMCLTMAARLSMMAKSVCASCRMARIWCLGLMSVRAGPLRNCRSPPSHSPSTAWLTICCASLVSKAGHQKEVVHGYMNAMSLSNRFSYRALLQILPQAAYVQGWHTDFHWRMLKLFTAARTHV